MGDRAEITLILARNYIYKGSTDWPTIAILVNKKTNVPEGAPLAYDAATAKQYYEQLKKGPFRNGDPTEHYVKWGNLQDGSLEVTKAMESFDLLNEYERRPRWATPEAA